MQTSLLRTVAWPALKFMTSRSSVVKGGIEDSDCHWAIGWQLGDNWVSSMGQHVLHPKVWWQLWMCTLSQCNGSDPGSFTEVQWKGVKDRARERAGDKIQQVSEMPILKTSCLQDRSEVQPETSRNRSRAWHIHEAAQAGSGCTDLSRNESPVWQAEVCTQLPGRSWSGLLLPWQGYRARICSVMPWFAKAGQCSPSHVSSPVLFCYLVWNWPELPELSLSLKTNMNIFTSKVQNCL